MNRDNPNDLQNELDVIEVYKNKIYKLKEHYKNETLFSKDTVTIVSSNNSNLFEKIQNLSKSNSNQDMSFGEINIADDGVLGITIDFDHNKQVFWEIGFIENGENSEIKDIVNSYEKIKLMLVK